MNNAADSESEHDNTGPGWAVHYSNRPVYDTQKSFARDMRRAPTPSEDALWQAIRHKALDGFKFRRQHVIDRYIVDFYCAEAWLVLEVDGEIHQLQEMEDAEHDAHLASLGLTVLRFTNQQVIHDLSTVLAEVRAALNRPRR